MHSRRKGFTLIELIIVVIIIAILASIAAPMMSNMKVRTICTEAVTTMGAIRVALRAYHVEYEKYPENLVIFDDRISIIGMKKEDLDGVFFTSDCYMYYFLSPDGFYIRCSPWVSQAPRKDETRNIGDGPYNTGSGLGFIFSPSVAYAAPLGPNPGLIMYHTGKITQIYIARSGYPQDDQTP